MSTLAPTLEAFFTQRLAAQRHASPHTVAAYRDTFRLLLSFAWKRTGTPPSKLDISAIDAPLVGDFLTHLEVDRGNSERTRNARLAAIRSLFRYAALRHPEHAGLIQQVLAIPSKRYRRALVSFLHPNEIDALLAAPDRTIWTGRRDHALLLVAIQTGLRVSELIQITRADVRIGIGAHLRCDGKGRKERVIPLTKQTMAVLQAWLVERGGHPTDPIFPSRRGGPLSRDAVERLLARHAVSATQRCPSLRTKALSPHVLRHTAAMQLRAAGVDISVIALWLGREGIETTQIYLHADLAIKEKALARTAPPHTTPGRYRPPDALLAFLEAL
jgi:site-specific recombinase XerD